MVAWVCVDATRRRLTVRPLGGLLKRRHGGELMYQHLNSDRLNSSGNSSRERDYSLGI
jgi:hypothetical protein